MDKVFITVPDNNKGKYITKGYAEAFKNLAFFVTTKKIYDLNSEEIIKINPQIIFSYWTDLNQKDTLIQTLNAITDTDTIFIHCAEKTQDIPEEFLSKKNNFCFTNDAKNENFILQHCINGKDYKTKFSKYKYGITFAGNPAFPQREKLLSKLIFNFGEIDLFCRSYDFYKSVDDIAKNKLLNDEFLELYRNSYKGYVKNSKELGEIYNSSKINIDMKNPDKETITYRCYEVMAAGGFLLTPYNNALIKQFDDGKELETYKNDDELIDKINFYLRNLNIAQLITQKGKQNTLSNHSFFDGLKKMLKVIFYDKDTCN